MAVSFTLRPWDWTGMIVYRVLHEEQYFGGQASSKEHQKELCEEFIDTVLRVSRARLQQGKPPYEYKSIKRLAIDLTGASGSREVESQRKIPGAWDVYGWRHDLTRKAEEITGLRRKLKYLSQEISEIKGLITHRNAPRGKEDEGTDPEGKEQNEVLDDQAT